LGIALFLHSSPRILAAIQLLGASYLGYLGIGLFLQKDSVLERQESALPKKAFVTGFLTNLLNPKAMVFILSLFSQFATAMNTLNMKIAFALSIPLIAICWFSSLSYFLTHPYFLSFLQMHQKKFMRAMAFGLMTLSFLGFLSILRPLLIAG
jgi:threonine/homoserine/homoserine lactone efflux protein